METTFAKDIAGAPVTGTGRTLTAIFDSKHDAEQAIASLRVEGLADAQVRLTDAEDSGAAAGQDEGFWDKLLGFFLPREDSDLYSEGLRRGHCLVTITGVPEGMEERAIAILDRDGAVDLEDRAAAWRAEGWTGRSEPYMPGGTAGMTGAAAAPVAEAPGHQPGGTAGMTGYTPPEGKEGRRDYALAGVRVRAYDRDPARK